MEECIALEDLHDGAKEAMAKKVPSKDGDPMEFFLMLWEEVGPILLEVLRDGLQKGVLHLDLSQWVSSSYWPCLKISCC